MMKKIFILLVFAYSLISCENQETIFPDFEGGTTGYFPYQFPVRTLTLGNDILYDNSNDNNHRFVVSVAMGGVYNNQTDRIFNFVVDETLCDNAYFDDGSPIQVLPSQYYTLSNPNQIVIPSGDFRGGVTVQLTDEFFNDPLAIKNSFVLPLRITSATNIDSVLQGKASTLNADRRIAGDWEIAPKDFTMFGIKFVNPYHGTYLMRGKASVNENGVKISDSTYQSTSGYIEHDAELKMATEGRTRVKVQSTSFKSKSMTGLFELVLNFASDKYDTQGGVACTVEAPEGASYTVSGSGKYSIAAAEFGGKKRDLIELTYTITQDNKEYTAVDRYVFRDKGIGLETFTPTIITEDL